MHVRCRFSENLTDFFCALTGVFIPKNFIKSSDKQVYDSILNQTKKAKSWKHVLYKFSNKKVNLETVNIECFIVWFWMNGRMIFYYNPRPGD